MKWTAVLFVLAAIGVCAFAVAKDGNDEVPASPFAGKVLVIYLEKTGTDTYGIPLVDAKVEKIAGRNFIVGIGAASHSEGDWVKGIHFSFALDKIVFSTDFTPQEYEKFCKDFGGAKNQL